MSYLGQHWGAIDLYVDHGIDEAEVVPNLALPEPEHADHIQEDDPDDEEASLESNHEDGDSDLERSPQDGADFVDVECQNAENNNEDIGKARAEGETQNVGEKDDVQSQYYDSDDPLSYQSEKEEAQASFEQTSAATSRFKYPSYNPNVESVELEVGTLYDDAKQFRKAMINYAVYSKRNIHFVRNEPHRVSLACDHPCPFQAHGSWDDTFKCFQLKTVTMEHMCNLKYSLRLVSQSWIEERYEDKIRDNPSIGQTELKKHIQSELKLNVGICMVKRAIKAVLKRIDAGFQDQFRRIRDYADECINSNPGTKAFVKTNKITPECPSVFQRFYVCFAALKKGFLEGCRKVIGLDGCFLKGMLKGEILSAVGRDANNQMYPIAWGIVEIENTDSWGWFLGQLKSNLGITDTSPWTIISDQQKGLTHVIKELFPDAEHRNCARHVHANWSTLQDFGARLSLEQLSSVMLWITISVRLLIAP
ncbi:PREDICTED: uncharacterized protein LOC109164765 [Ipomoea nil]|uniref:uncharacterized protein LOC109164765 n=1 Tax=Ipomoea nil TaxID=35883 RepID=UPI00090180E5|nr:PREDICTED: uncharacterized protein LOC109164765 [Ipomoea nil]